jgi:hypothetical protein
VYAHQGYTWLKHAGGLFNAVKKHYPQHKWDMNRWKQSVASKSQRYLFKMLKKLLGNRTEIYFNQPLDFLRYKDTGQIMTADIWIPEHRIVVEYQGSQHYVPCFYKDFEYQVVKDHERMMACKEANVTLILIPYWWDYKMNSLAATLKEVCNFHWKIFNYIHLALSWHSSGTS